MNSNADPATFAVAALIATAGLWWFRLVLKDVRRAPPITRTGIYVLVWLAYFVLAVVLAGQMATRT